jgi:hypothetical protein
MSSKWANVDTAAKKWVLPETKNERPHTIHLSKFAITQLSKLEAYRDAETAVAREKAPGAKPSPWVTLKATEPR